MESEDASSVRQSQPLEIMSFQEPILFEWNNKWLKGHEYAFILKNIEAYCQKFGFIKYPHKTHPLDIYQNPQNGVIYFVKGTGVGSQFGFPRVQIKKKYRWKKMNFTTDLPKKNPQVTYVVASASRAHKIDNNDHPLYRMHAVVIHGEAKNEIGYILCHVRQMQKKKQEEDSLSNCLQDNYKFSYYKLFAFLHNFRIQQTNMK